MLIDDHRAGGIDKRCQKRHDADAGSFAMRHYKPFKNRCLQKHQMRRLAARGETSNGGFAYRRSEHTLNERALGLCVCLL